MGFNRREEMNKSHRAYTIMALVSLPVSQLLISKFNLHDIYISAYWLLLGGFCLFTFLRSYRFKSQSISHRVGQILNLSLGPFAVVTAFLAGYSYLHIPFTM